MKNCFKVDFYSRDIDHGWDYQIEGEDLKNINDLRSEIKNLISRAYYDDIEERLYYLRMIEWNIINMHLWSGFAGESQAPESPLLLF
jgi:hypothetical protein